MSKKKKELTLEERIKIEAYLRLNKSQAEIGRLLGRNRSVICREIKRAKSIQSKGYNAKTIHLHARVHRVGKRTGTNISNNPVLKLYVLNSLKKGWSPEQISGRLKIDYPNDESMRISHESIYKWIYSRPNHLFKNELIALLPYKKKKRYRYNKRKAYRGKIVDYVSIDNRPLEIESRKQPGHWEGDLIIGKGQSSAIGTIVERTTRYTIIVPIDSKKSKHVAKAFAREILKMPKNFLKSLTYDNGIEMAAHKDFSKRTNMNVYFAHPYSSWERGTNENTNGLIRRVFNKKTNFNNINIKQLKSLQDSLNNRPRKVLGYKTPNELVNLLSA